MIKSLLKNSSFRRFVREEDGLVTIEWVGISAIAAIAALAVAGGVYEVVGTNAKTVPTTLCSNATLEGKAVAGKAGASATLGDAC
jgi:Flp pilus assembly pilin Flp